jgi:GNAT superfamily N-acetyltransferase
MTGDPATDEPGRLQLRVTAYDDPVVRRLDEAVQAEYVERYGGPDETAVEHDEFGPPGGVFLVGWADDEPVACGGLRRHDDTTAEIKRMFVTRGHRRRGYARRLLAALEQQARALGYSRVVLETGLAQPEALALYPTSGYQPMTGFGHYRDSPLSRSFGKDL